MATAKLISSLYGQSGKTWAARLTGTALMQVDQMIGAHSDASHVEVGGVKVSPKYLMTHHGMAELEYKQKLKKELKLMMEQAGMNPKLLQKMELKQMEKLKYDLRNTPTPSRPSPKLDLPGR